MWNQCRFTSTGVSGGGSYATPQLIEGFTRAIMDCQLQDCKWGGDASDNPNMRFAELPSQFEWLSLDSTHLFIRNHYEHVWQHILKSLKPYIARDRKNIKHKRCLILGQPGIGKSASGNYFLKRGLDAGYRVLYETTNKRYFFDPTSPDAQVEDMLESRLLHFQDDPLCCSFMTTRRGGGSQYCLDLHRLPLFLVHQMRTILATL